VAEPAAAPAAAVMIALAASHWLVVTSSVPISQLVLAAATAQSRHQSEAGLPPTPSGYYSKPYTLNHKP
jgi:hypothetical protein